MGFFGKRIRVLDAVPAHAEYGTDRIRENLCGIKRSHRQPLALGFDPCYDGTARTTRRVGKDHTTFLCVTVHRITPTMHRRRTLKHRTPYSVFNAAFRASIRASATRRGSSARSCRSSMRSRFRRSARRRGSRSQLARASGLGQRFHIRGTGTRCSHWSKRSRSLRMGLSGAGPNNLGRRAFSDHGANESEKSSS